jgi:N-methylhydantoinase A
MSGLDLAAAIIQVAESNMANAIKMVSVAHGYDPRDFTLIAFGGAGPLHATAIARSLNIPRVTVPPVPGNFSALGLLLADARVDKVWTRAVRSDVVDPSDITSQLDAMRKEVVSELRRNGHLGDPVILTSINMRYLGQNYENEVPVPPSDFTRESLDCALDSFHEMHQTIYGYAFRHAIIELISFQVTAIGATQKPGFDKLRQPLSEGKPKSRPVFFPGQGWVDALIHQRTTLASGQELTGPAIIQESGSTTVLCPGDTLRVDEHGILLIDVGRD